MFRHSTKQTVRSQDWLRKRAVKALDGDRQILCESIYDNTYCTDLPESSVSILNNIISPLTGCSSLACKEKRKVFTMLVLEYQDLTRVRISFIQPEVSSATANTSSGYSSVLNNARSGLLLRLNNPSPGRISVSTEKCQVAGRLAPYIIDESGLGSSVSWSYCNASKSRFLYIVTELGGTRLLSITKETAAIYQGFCVQDCAIVYVPTTRCFKVTVSPERGEMSEEPNKSTCIFLYHDGTFKVLGTPEKSYKVCKLFRDTVVRAHLSSMHSRILSTLVPASEIGS